MTLVINSPGAYVFYQNFRTEGTGTNFAEAEQVLTFSQLIENSSNYVISIERFRVPLQSVPMQDARANAIAVVVKNGNLPVAILNLIDSYSLNDFMVQINTTNPPDLIFSLTADGRMRIDFDGFAANNIILDPEIADVFDMPTIIGQGIDGTGVFIGGTPIFDRFDNVHKIQIEAQTGLASIQQEIVSTEVFANLLTDFLVPNNISMSYTGTAGVVHDSKYTVNYDVRQDIEFNSASDRRMIMLRGTSPIQNIKLEVAVIDRRGRRRRIRLPPRSILEIKIAFWKKQ